MASFCGNDLNRRFTATLDHQLRETLRPICFAFLGSDFEASNLKTLHARSVTVNRVDETLSSKNSLQCPLAELRRREKTDDQSFAGLQ